MVVVVELGVVAPNPPSPAAGWSLQRLSQMTNNGSNNNRAPRGWRVDSPTPLHKHLTGQTAQDGGSAYCPRCRTRRSGDQEDFHGWSLAREGTAMTCDPQGTIQPIGRRHLTDLVRQDSPFGERLSRTLPRSCTVTYQPRRSAIKAWHLLLLLCQVLTVMAEDRCHTVTLSIHVPRPPQGVFLLHARPAKIEMPGQTMDY
ncbi:hypothetical protein RRG08_033741 [Elysia crispata]|uniref:Uncharacterized protein n=1 Tax=Elysia crispata TaxID=231223 RepID=A0AAE1A8W8_9GAST|nr:hypothetical protein RRG08_033741 [Elysia crispata]